MKQLIRQPLNSKFLFAIILACLMAPFAIHAQQNPPGNFSELEQLQDKRMDYLKQLYRITEKYPAFAYKYDIENGQVQNVSVTGVKNDLDTKKIRVMLLDLQSNKNKFKNKANRMGVFYTVDQRAQFKKGEDALNDMLHESLSYPQNAKNWGIEGTIYVKFVVDEKGNIPYAATTDDLKLNNSYYAKELEKQAVDAIKKTSGEWQPGEINGVKVSSFLVIPISFDLKRNPTIPAMI